MSTTTYQTRCWGELFEVSADWAQAACPVHGCNGKQVADFQHFPERAMRWALTTEAEAGGWNPDDIDDEEDATIAHTIDVAVSNMVEIEDTQSEEEDES